MAEADAVRALLRRSGVLGAELETRYRVLGVTVEDPDAAGDDRRRQVLFHPVGEFTASLRRRSDDGVEILTFPVERLPDIVTRFEGAGPLTDPLPRERPDVTAWGPEPSLAGNSPAADGRAAHLHLAIRAEDAEFDLHATFDEIEVRDAAGTPLDTF
jgi:hypothetical protein